MALTSEVLFQNRDQTVTLLDIPRSISLGQIFPGQPLKRVLLSSPALQEPYPSTEPKSEKARAKVVSRMGPVDDTYTYTAFIRAGLEEIRKLPRAKWCLPRQLSNLKCPQLAKKRKIDHLYSSNENVTQIEEPDDKMFLDSARLAGASSHACILTEVEGLVTIQNPTLASSAVIISVPPSTYDIPALGGVILCTINSKTAAVFSEVVSQLYASSTPSAGSGQFDFILLDPPWQNRSVTRSKAYKTVGEDDPMVVLRDILGIHIASEGLIACWITNKRSARMSALACFQAWNIGLIEEWVWMKTTAGGEPVYDLDGLWRKPYEVLLLGRKLEPNVQNPTRLKVDTTTTIQRRLIVGVPDLHSRKPCLRNLIRRLMPDPMNYRALEIFARNMTAGWLAWGDEAIKFNWCGHWSQHIQEDFRDENERTDFDDCLKAD